MPNRLEDYAFLSDCHSAALVSRHGSVDWLCYPRFDLSACFVALVGTPERGRWLLAPDEPIVDCRRYYLGDSLVLRTEYDTPTGSVAICDFMSPRASS